MKVLLVNGSPNKTGCTFTALSVIAETLKEEGVELPEQEKNRVATNFIR